MPTTYKGTVIPLSSDLADGPAAFRDYTDSLPAADAVTATSFPVGFLGFSCANVAPAGWLLLDGTTVAGAQTLYPKLWAVVPVGWQSGANLILPDCRGRIIIGRDPSDTNLDVAGDKTGGKTVTLITGNLPAHAHTFTTSTDAHTHGTAGSFVNNTAGGGIYSGGIGGSLAAATTSDSHSHTGTTTNTGSATPLSIMPPVIAFNVVIRAV